MQSGKFSKKMSSWLLYHHIIDRSGGQPCPSNHSVGCSLFSIWNIHLMLLFFYQIQTPFLPLLSSGNVSDTYLYMFYCFLPLHIFLSRCLCVANLATTWSTQAYSVIQTSFNIYTVSGTRENTTHTHYIRPVTSSMSSSSFGYIIRVDVRHGNSYSLLISDMF